MDRRDWPISRYKLGQEPSDDLSRVTTPLERFEMMWPLAKEAWLLAGHPIPGDRRENAPGRVLRPPALRK